MEIREIQEATSEFIGKFWSESAGAFQRAEKEVNAVVGHLVEKGKITQGEGQRLFADLSAKLRDRREQFEKRVETGSRWALDRLNIPTKNEVDELSSRVNALTRKVANLKKQLVV